MRFSLVPLVLLIACSDPGESEPPDNNDVCLLGDDCPPPAATDCPPRSRPKIGQESCVPVGITGCPNGFVDDATGWGCDPIQPAGCVAPAVALLGTTECQAVGPSPCPEGFSPGPSGFGCVDLIDSPCDLSQRATPAGCVPIGPCDGPFPPPEATRVVGASGGYQTISDALAGAAAGEVIAIDAGRYTDALVPQVSLSIIGKCAAEVFIRNDGRNAAGVHAVGVAVNVKGVSLIGHTEGLTAENGGKITASEVRVQEAGSIGVYAGGAGTEVTLTRSVVRDTRYPAQLTLAKGIQAVFDATVVLEDVEISTTQGVGLSSAGSDATHVTGRRVMIIDTSMGNRGDGGYGALVLDDAHLELVDSAIVRSPIYGLLVSDVGSSATLTHVAIRQTRATETRAGGIVVTAGGSLVADGVSLVENVGVGMLCEDAESSCTLTNMAITNTSALGDVPTAGLMLDTDTQTTLSHSAILNNGDGGVVMRGANLTIDHSVVYSHRSPTVEDEGIGILAGRGSSLTVSDCGFGGSRRYEVEASDQSTVTLERVLVEEGSLAAYSGSVMTVRDSAVLRANDLGIDAGGTNTRLLVERTAIHSVRPSVEESIGDGIVVREGATGTVIECDLADNEERGAFVQLGGQLEMQRSNLRNARATAKDQNGFGVGVHGGFIATDVAFVDNRNMGLFLYEEGWGATATVTGALFLRNGISGVFADDKTHLALRDLAVLHQRENEKYRDYGYGILAAGDSFLTEVLARSNTSAGIVLGASALSATSTAVITGCVVERTLMGHSGFGHGIIASNIALLKITGSHIYGNAGVGIALERVTAHVEDTVVASNAVGIHVQGGSGLSIGGSGALAPLEVRVEDSTRFLENDSRVGVQEIAVPDPFTDLEGTSEGI